MARHIDDSHHAFKRTGRIGPGPRKRPAVHQERDWECQARTPTKTHYVQICTYVGGNKDKRGKKMRVMRKKSSKKAYNRLWRKWAAKTGRIKTLQSKGAKAGYRCRKTPAAKCR